MFDLSTLAQTCAIPWCPAPPSWSVDWTAIIRQYVWLRSLADVPQDPDYHAEGDVLTHTHMVVEALAGMDAWQGLDENVRSLLFAAALLHDIAKPASTRTEVDGRITSPGHARRGAQMTRALLWAGDTFAEPPPFPWRETVARLVRFHGLPLWFWEKTDPRRAVIEASQSVRLDWVALLAEADARGRVCADQAELIERVDLFRAYCVEQRCYDRPRAFGSPHGRFRYFRRPHADPDYVGYERHSR